MKRQGGAEGRVNASWVGMCAQALRGHSNYQPLNLTLLSKPPQHAHLPWPGQPCP